MEKVKGANEGVPVTVGLVDRNGFFAAIYEDIRSQVLNDSDELRIERDGKEVILRLPPKNQFGDFASLRFLGHEPSGMQRLQVFYNFIDTDVRHMFTVLSDCKITALPD